MKQQYVKLFIGFSESVDTQINEFLNKHLNYTIDKITFSGRSTDRALVVFNVGEEPSYSVASGCYSVLDLEQGCKIEKISRGRKTK